MAEIPSAVGLLRRFRRLPIRTQLLWLIGVVLAPAFGAFFAEMADERRSIRVATYMQAQSQANAIATSLSHFFSVNETVLRRLAMRPKVRALNARDCDPILKDYVSLHTEFVNMAVRDLDGKNDCSYQSFVIPQSSFLKFPWFRQAQHSDEFRVGEVYNGPLNGAALSVMSYPVHDDAGKQTGMVLLPIDLQRLNRQVFGGMLPNMVVMVVDGNNRVALRSTDADKWLGKTVPERTVANDSGQPAGLWQATDPSGVRWLFVVAEVPKTNWTVRVGLHANVVLADSEAAFTRGLLLRVGILWLAWMLCWWIARGIARPIDSLVATVDKLVEGNTGVRAPQVYGPAQIEGLMRTFNVMLDTRDSSEARLREGETNLSITLNSIGDAVIATDSLGCITRMNPVAERLTGWPLAHATGLPLTDVFRIINSDTRLPALNPVQLVMSHGEVVGLANHTALLARDGQEYQISDSAAPIRNDEGQIVGVVLVFSDVTEKYVVQEALIQAERNYRILFEQSADAILVAGHDGRIVRANLSASQLFGYSAAELVGMPTAALVQSDEKPKMAQSFRKVAAGERVSAERHYRRKDGSDFYGELRATQLTKGLVVGIIRDISARKEAEQVREALLQEKTALLNEVHHRVKNNLQVITSLLRLESRRSPHEATKAVLTDMQERIRSMALLHEFIYRAGNFAAIDLGSYIRQIATQSFQSLRESSEHVQLRLELGSVQVGLDQATPCGLLVSELISNTLKHAFPNERKGEVCIVLEPVGEAGQQPAQWCLRVSDNGVGLPADFETRRHNSLGLQLVDSLALQLGATMTVGPDAVFALTFTVLPPHIVVPPEYVPPMNLPG